MSTVQSLLEKKGNTIHAIHPDATVLDATKLMNWHKIGALLVQDSQDGPPQIVGILTERDVLQRVIATERNPREVRVGQVMTSDVVYCNPETPIEEISAIMKQRRIRHIPVMDEHRQLVGMVSIGDVNAWHASSQEIEIQYLHEYIHGRV